MVNSGNDDIDNNNFNNNDSGSTHSVESGCITSHFTSYGMVVQTRGSLRILPWESHRTAANFCWPETQSESQDAPLKKDKADEVLAWPTPQLV